MVVGVAVGVSSLAQQGAFAHPIRGVNQDNFVGGYPVLEFRQLCPAVDKPAWRARRLGRELAQPDSLIEQNHLLSETHIHPRGKWFFSVPCTPLPQPSGHASAQTTVQPLASICRFSPRR